jgi:hypothetical protein
MFLATSKLLCRQQKLWHSSGRICGGEDFEAAFFPTFSSVCAVLQRRPQKMTVKNATKISAATAIYIAKGRHSSAGRAADL